MTISSLSEAAMHQQISTQSFSRGESYYRGDTIVSLVQRGNVLCKAEVESSQHESYCMRVT